MEQQLFCFLSASTKTVNKNKKRKEESGQRFHLNTKQIFK